MPTARIEPTGCCVRKGKVQIRLCFYLEPNDARYAEHHIQVPIIPPEGYPGEVGEFGRPVDRDAYKIWIESLPKKWQNAPFYNHFIYVKEDVTDAEIREQMKYYLRESYAIWSEGNDILKNLKSKETFKPGDTSYQNISKCEMKVNDIKNRASYFEYSGLR